MKDTSNNLVQAELDKQLSKVAAKLREGELPSTEQLALIDSLSKLKTAVPKHDSRSARVLELVFLFAAVTVLLCSVYFRVPSTTVEADIHISGMKIGFTKNRSEILLPGEHGEVVGLKQANISGATQIEPPWIQNDGGALELRSDEASPSTSVDGAVRLEELRVPVGGPFNMAVSIAYRPGLRGLIIANAGSQPTTGSFAEMIAVPSAQGARDAKPVLRPVIVSGKELRVELFPVNAQAQFTVLRDIPISTISFEDAESSSILGGSLFVKSLSPSKVLIQPGDHLQLNSNQPMLIREVTFSKGQINVKVSVPQATALFLGDKHPQNLMPSFFDWVHSRWPTQLYATLSAAVALWLAMKQWWRPSA